MEKQRPIFERRLSGIRIAVWENVSDNGEGKKPWWNVALTRRYRDGDEWKDASTFNGLADLAVVQEAVTQAQAFIRGRVDELDAAE